MEVLEKTDLIKIKDDYNDKINSIKQRIIVCAGTACVANGALKIYQKFIDYTAEKGINLTIELNDDNHDGILLSGSGCQGFCQMGPLVTILPDNIFYTKVKPEDAEDIIEKTIIKKETFERLLYKDPLTGVKQKSTDDINFYKKQKRFVLKKCGLIDPENIFEFIANDGYKEAKNVILNMESQAICDYVTDSGLRGRGGAGFLTGKKWEVARIQNNKKKYIICNADEGDPGAFMDRSVMEGNPHSVIEGMLIASKAIGANEGYIYVRAEYPLAVKRIKKAAADAYKLGLLGKNIFGTDICFDLKVMEGAGAFVCGEETALMSSIEGKRGMPSPKPPFPAVKGLWGKPTVINNVETFATVGLIFAIGKDEYKKIGTEKSKGTKTFAITGHVANTGLIEVPFGSTLRQIINDIAGGVTSPDGTISLDNFKAVQIGGPSGACLTKEHLDFPLDFDSLRSIGAMIGSGGLVVMNKETCMVNIAAYFMQFTQNESCGKCVLCREGTKQMLNLLNDIKSGKGDQNTIDLLTELAMAIKEGSLCALGKSAPNPVLSAIKYFPEEYMEHVVNKKCPAKQCPDLITIKIDKDLCKGCGLCARKCPVGAISGEVKKPYVIDEKLCIKCGVCLDSCKFKAIVK